LLGAGTPADNSNAFWGGDLTIDGTNKYSYAAGVTGGSSRQPLDIKHLPAHNHPPLNSGDWGIAEYRNVIGESGVWKFNLTNTGSGLLLGAYDNGTTYMALQSSTGNTGGNVPHNNMPPFFSVYMWKRTA
jgi:microcystin-dependent protein